MKLYIDKEGDYWVGDSTTAVFIGEDINAVKENFGRAVLPFKRADIKYDLREV